jgi:hypothetical protein
MMMMMMMMKRKKYVEREKEREREIFPSHNHSKLATSLHCILSLILLIQHHIKQRVHRQYTSFSSFRYTQPYNECVITKLSRKTYQY